MASNEDRAQRWMDRILRRTDRDLAPNGNVFYDPGDLTIYSYGYHFPLAMAMTERDGSRWVLLNGDRYSRSTSEHQGIVRGVVRDAGLPHIIVPFNALDAAGIERRSIEPLEVRADRTVTIPHSASEVTGDHLPMNDPSGATEDKRVWVGHSHEGADEQGYLTVERPKQVPDPDRRYVSQNRGIAAERSIALDGAVTWHWETRRHWLGDSIFRAKVRGGRERARFLSSFDYQEAQPLYFLCELPRSSKAETVEQAYEDLKPPQVQAAEAQLRTVTRQGDMFAIPTTFSTREVKEMTPHGKGRIVKRPRLGLLGTNHTTSEVIFATQGRVYARGLLYHQPGPLRDPDHARRKIGDGRTWHLLVKNTVPAMATTAPTRERTPA